MYTVNVLKNLLLLFSLQLLLFLFLFYNLMTFSQLKVSIRKSILQFQKLQSFQLSEDYIIVRFCVKQEGQWQNALSPADVQLAGSIGGGGGGGGRSVQLILIGQLTTTLNYIEQALNTFVSSGFGCSFNLDHYTHKSHVGNLTQYHMRD